MCRLMVCILTQKKDANKSESNNLPPPKFKSQTQDLTPNPTNSNQRGSISVAKIAIPAYTITFVNTKKKYDYRLRVQ